MLRYDSEGLNGSLSQLKECRAGNDECVAEKDSNTALHYNTLTLAILSELILTFPDSSSDRKKAGGAGGGGREGMASQQKM